MTGNPITPKQRLAALEAELALGEARLARLDAEREALLHQMLRIEGAILLLRELDPSCAPGAQRDAPK